MKPRYLVLLVAMNVLWAASYPIFKYLQMESGALTTLRFGIAAAMLLAAWPWFRGGGPTLADMPRIGCMGVLVFCMAPRLQIEGVNRGQAGDTSLLMALDPLITALAAALFLRERVPARRWWGCLLGMVGVVLLSKIWTGEAAPMRGLLANSIFMASFFCEAAYSVLGKPLLHRCSPLKLLACGATAGTVANLLLDLTVDHGATWASIKTMNATAWLLVLYLAVICSIVGYTLWFVVIRESEVNIAGLTVLVQPLAGLLLSVIWIGESLHWGQLWGTVAIVIGLGIGLRSNSASNSSAATTARPNEVRQPVV